LPDYSDSDSTKVSVFLTKKEPDEAFARMVAEERRRKGSAIPVQSLLILNELKAHKQCTLGDLEKSVDVAKSRLTSVVGQLVDEGLVDATASDAATVYTLAYMGQTELQGADKVLQPSEVIMRFAEQRGYVTTADVRELLHLPKNQNAYYEITKLVKQNKLQITGSGRGSRYIPVKG
jgi:ATP-dependent DNA helicase RecG